MTRFLLVCAGGALGTGVRYLLGGWIPRWAGTAFPYSTLTVNVVGSFLMGLVMTVALQSPSFNPTLRVALTTGILGGFTTYSSFNYELMSLLQDRAWLLTGVYAGATFVGCLFCGALGIALARFLLGE